MDAVYVPPSGPPQGPGPSKEIFERMGLEAIFRMCEDFYQRLGQSEIKHLFPEDLVHASRKQAAFLVGVLGGPPLYHQQFGPPRMRARHLPFVIDEKARNVWLGCFRNVLENAETVYGFPGEHLPGFLAWLEEFSTWMVNRQTPPPA